MAGRLSEEEAERIGLNGPMLAAKKQNKYNVADRARRTMDGVVYDSVHEMKALAELYMRQRIDWLLALRAARHSGRVVLVAGERGTMPRYAHAAPEGKAVERH